MATTSGTTAAGKAITGQGDSKGKKGRVAGLVATAALGLGLLGGLVLSQTRPAEQPAAAPASGNPASAPAAPNQDWALYDGTRPGLLGLSPGETSRATLGAEQQQFLAWNLVLPTGGAATHGTGPADEFTQADGSAGIVASPPFTPDQFTYREDHRTLAPDNQGCTYASAAGVPGEGCDR